MSVGSITKIALAQLVKALLKRPAEERHYRSVWAAFMLGKAALKTGNPEAVKWFQLTRELAKTGFADSLGMAADSYGWEGRSEWKQNHPEKAARLFLTQLALGDESAIVSLKALIPDRDPVDGMLNYGPEPDEKRGWSQENKKAEEQKALLALKAAAQDRITARSGNSAHSGNRIGLKPSKAELLRLSKNRIMPDLRFDYRVIAGALAVRAADLLEDNTEELVDVLNTAGLWVKDRDERVGNR